MKIIECKNLQDVQIHFNGAFNQKLIWQKLIHLGVYRFLYNGEKTKVILTPES